MLLSTLKSLSMASQLARVICLGGVFYMPVGFFAFRSFSVTRDSDFKIRILPLLSFLAASSFLNILYNNTLCQLFERRVLPSLLPYWRLLLPAFPVYSYSIFSSFHFFCRNFPFIFSYYLITTFLKTDSWFLLTQVCRQKTVLQKRYMRNTWCFSIQGRWSRLLLPAIGPSLRMLAFLIHRILIS